MSTANEASWISLAEARRLAVIGRTGLSELVEKGLVSIRRMPGSRPRIRRDELEKIIAESTKTTASRGCAECP